jgi:hypothetical protein
VTLIVRADARERDARAKHEVQEPPRQRARSMKQPEHRARMVARRFSLPDAPVMVHEVPPEMQIGRAGRGVVPARLDRPTRVDFSAVMSEQHVELLSWNDERDHAGSTPVDRFL